MKTTFPMLVCILFLFLSPLVGNATDVEQISVKSGHYYSIKKGESKKVYSFETKTPFNMDYQGTKSMDDWVILRIGGMTFDTWAQPRPYGPFEAGHYTLEIESRHTNVAPFGSEEEDEEVPGTKCEGKVVLFPCGQKSPYLAGIH